jgi:hypothetical protein
MIHEIFPVKILIKDFDMSQDWTDTIKASAKECFSDFLATAKDYSSAGAESCNFFTKERMENVPEVKQLKEMFIDGFYELAQACGKNPDGDLLTREEIAEKLKNDPGKLPFMRKGDVRTIHNHTRASALAIFYLNDLDNERQGGQLVLHDPSFHDLVHFFGYNKYYVPTKKNRMVIIPSHVWHEVSQYLGDEERMTIAINLLD